MTLSGYLALDWLRLLGHVDGAHAALADLLQQLVGADHRAGDCGRRSLFTGILKRPGGPRFGRGVLKKTARAVVEPQQILHLLAQFRLSGAGLVQIGLVLGRVFLLQGGDEDVALGHGSPGSRRSYRSVRNPCADRANFSENSAWRLRLGVVAAQGAEQPGAGISPQEIRAAW